MNDKEDTPIKAMDLSDDASAYLLSGFEWYPRILPARDEYINSRYYISAVVAPERWDDAKNAIYNILGEPNQLFDHEKIGYKINDESRKIRVGGQQTLDKLVDSGVVNIPLANKFGSKKIMDKYISKQNYSGIDFGGSNS